MVAARKSQQHHAHNAPAAKNVVRKAKRADAVVDVRREARVRVTLPAWVCGESLSGRGYALEMNAGGARFGGMGLKLRVGEPVLVKLVVDPQDAPVVMRGEVVRYAPNRGACPDLCVRFVDAPVDEHFRIARFLDGLRSGT